MFSLSVPMFCKEAGLCLRFGKSHHGQGGKGRSERQKGNMPNTHNQPSRIRSAKDTAVIEVHLLAKYTSRGFIKMYKGQHLVDAKERHRANTLACYSL